MAGGGDKLSTSGGASGGASLERLAEERRVGFSGDGSPGTLLNLEKRLTRGKFVTVVGGVSVGSGQVLMGSWGVKEEGPIAVRI